jgi:hypothetical protein
MKPVFFLIILSIPFFSFNSSKNAAIKSVLHETGIVDSIILSYRPEFKNYVLTVYNDAYYLAEKENYKSRYEEMKNMLGDSYTTQIRKEDSISLQYECTRLDSQRNYFEKKLRSIKIWNNMVPVFKSTDSLLTVTWKKNSDCIDYCIYQYKGKIIKITTFNYDAFFELYYSEKALIMFKDTVQDNGCCRHSSYSGIFYFDKSAVIYQKITGMPDSLRQVPFGNRCSHNVFNQKDSILNFSNHILRGIVINSCFK